MYEIHFENIQFALQFQEIHIPTLLAVKYIGNTFNKRLTEDLRLESQKKGFDLHLLSPIIKSKVNPYITQVSIQNSILSFIFNIHIFTLLVVQSSEIHAVRYRIVYIDNFPCNKFCKYPPIRKLNPKFITDFKFETLKWFATNHTFT